MKFLSYRRSLLEPRFAVATLVCALGILGFGAQSASASCGDYLLHSGSDRYAQIIHSGDAGAQLPSIPLPCRGPGCRNAPHHEAPPPVPPPTITVDHWACLFGESALVLSSGHRWAIEPLLLSPPGFPLEIDRPPRG